LRKTYAVSRETLSQRSGIAEERIRRIEEEGLIPDLAPLLKIARALGVRLGTLLDDHEELGPVLCRAGEAKEAGRFVTGLPGGSMPPAGSPQGLVFHALAADKGGRHMEPFVVDIEPGADQTKSSHEGEEFMYVLDGTLAVEYGETAFTLGVGDSIYYDSIVPHRVLSGGEKPARIVAVLYTPV
jgi:mannose-6-phosphate isomerase-like protein (cupin superfamily)/transcriptional regulator with XRE-family HTH domain